MELTSNISKNSTEGAKKHEIYSNNHHLLDLLQQEHAPLAISQIGYCYRKFISDVLGPN